MTPKELKKLAAACRASGIKHYKSGDIEFTLSDDAPVSTYKRKQVTQDSSTNSTTSVEFETDSLTEDQLLMWSVRADIGAEDKKPEQVIPNEGYSIRTKKLRYIQNNG